MAAGLFLWGALCWTAISRKEIHKRLLLYCAGPVLFVFSWPLIVPAVLETRKAPGAFLLSNTIRISPGSVLVAENGLAAAVCWYHKRSNVYILSSKGEYEYGLSYADSRYRSLDIEQLRDMIAQQDETGSVVLITKAGHYAEYKEQLPNPSYKKTHDGLVWVEYTSASESVTPISQLSE